MATEYSTVRVVKPVHSKISQLGTCGMSKSQVIEKLIDFYEKSIRAVKKVNKNKKGVNDFADQLTPTDVMDLFNIDKTSRL
jgi:hypothetical protein